MEQKIYQYTSIDTLALILQSKQILFNRLDKVDDLEEGGIIPNGVKIGKYVFVSCWTENSEENIPLWKMYTNGVGVRIGLKKDMFKDFFLSGKTYDGYLNGSIKSKIPLDEFSNPNYFVLPLFDENYGFFYRKIQYVDSVVDKTNKSIEENHGSMSISFKDVGTYKNRRWAFQEESRFVIAIIPKSPCLKFTDAEYGNWLAAALKNNIELPLDKYFLYLKDEVFDYLEICLSPNISYAKKLIVEALRDKYAPNAIIKDSNLNGLTKLK